MSAATTARVILLPVEEADTMPRKKKAPRTTRVGTSIRLRAVSLARADALAAAAAEDPALAERLGVEGAPVPDRSAILRRAIDLGLAVLETRAAK